MYREEERTGGVGLRVRVGYFESAGQQLHLGIFNNIKHYLECTLNIVVIVGCFCGPAVCADRRLPLEALPYFLFPPGNHGGC